MRHRDDENPVATDLIDHAVGKPVGEATSCAFGKLGPSLRMIQDAVDGVQDFGRELVAQVGSLLVIEFDCFFKFDSGRLKNAELRHRVFVFRSPRKTALPVTTLISPRSYASMRLSTSSTHSLSIALCLGRLRLSSSLSASCARDRGGNDKAWSMILAVLRFMRDPRLSVSIF